MVYVDNVLSDGCKKASKIATSNFNEIEKLVGIS